MQNLEKLTLELGRFIEGAEDVAGLSWDKSPRPRVVAAAANCLRVFGVEAEALRGRLAGELFAGGERAARDLTEACEVAPCSVPRLLIRQGGAMAGQQFPARLTLRNDRAGTVALVRDLTVARGETDAVLREADLSRFASLVAHEVRNPLSAVKIALQTLERRAGLQANDRRRAEIAIREVGNIEALLSELTEFARPASLSKVPVDPRGPLREAVEALLPEWRLRGVELRLDSPERMSPVQADPTRLRAAAHLLLRHAAQAAEEAGGGEVLLIVRELPAKDRRRSWQLEVRDRGRPLSPEARQQAFEPFHPARARGSGLALAVVDRIAREHSGTVAFEEAEGGGNRVVMTLSQD